MARRPNHHPMSHAERLAVVEERLDTLTAEMVEIGQKLDKLLQLGFERAGAVDSVKASVEGLQRGYAALKNDTAVIRQSMTFARVLRRLFLWGTPFVGAVIYIVERFDIIARLFRRG